MSGVQRPVVCFGQGCGGMDRARFSRVGPCQPRRKMSGGRGMLGGQCIVGMSGGQDGKRKSYMCQ